MNVRKLKVRRTGQWLYMVNREKHKREHEVEARSKFVERAEIGKMRRCHLVVGSFHRHIIGAVQPVEAACSWESNHCLWCAIIAGIYSGHRAIINEII